MRVVSQRSESSNSVFMHGECEDCDKGRELFVVNGNGSSRSPGLRTDSRVSLAGEEEDSRVSGGGVETEGAEERREVYENGVGDSPCYLVENGGRDSGEEDNVSRDDT